MTLLDVLRGASSYLEKRGVESARLNAEHLLAHVLGKRNRMELYLEFERPLGEGERAPLRDLVRRRGEGVPLQHLLGTVEFLGREFLCDKRALVPRPETELLVELVLARWDGGGRAVDIGTGSGVIALSLASAHGGAEVCGVDLSAEALDLARANAEKLGLRDCVEFVQGDLLSGVEGTFDLIVSNPPYIASAEIPGLQREVQHDPVMALDGGAGGLEIIGRLAAEAAAKLAPGGMLALEIGAGQAVGVCALLERNKLRDIGVERDYHGVERFVFSRNG
jgi:release factor glutamine methyltransferase